MASWSSFVKQEENDIICSAEDKRKYRAVHLTNGLKMLLISDPDTDKSSAAMDVHVGSMSDPDDIPGLAHFCEHMLFLGTEKYPSENEYNKFLSEHGGASNAYTSGEHTNYYFDVSPEHLNGALDRFAQFFLCPLFTESATEREVNAVNSENDKNIPSDPWRMLQLEKATINPDHPYSKFGTGNIDTLLTIPKSRGQDVRDELLKFHKKYYSSNLMALALLGKESLDELMEMAVPLFGPVENENVPIPTWPDHPIREEDTKLSASIVPIKDVRNLTITWPMEDLRQYYKSNPGHYLGHLIGHEGPGSLLSELKSRGWVNTLVGGEKDGALGFMFFIVNVDLTQEGIEHTDDIITLIFQYINMLRKEDPHKWVHDECAQVSEMSFRFKDKEKPRNYTTSSVSRLHYISTIPNFPMKELLCAGYHMEEFKPELITSILEKLTPRNARVAIVGQKFTGTTDRKEKWYGTDYSMTKIPEETLRKWENAGLHESLRLPDKNEFIPTNFELFPRDENPAINPVIIRNSAFSKVWYKQDNTFLMPKACVSMDFTSLYAYLDPLCTNLTYMFVALFRDALNEYSYAAEIAGLQYDLNNTLYGLTLSIRGYHDKQNILLQKVMQKMAGFTVNPKRFDIIKESYIRGLKNFKAEQPYQHALYYTMVLTSEQMWTKEELLEATEDLTVGALEKFIPQLLSWLYLEILVHGNVTEARALELADIAETTLQKEANSRALAQSQQKHFRKVQLPFGCPYSYNKRHNEVHKSSALEIYYQCSTEDTHANMLLELFCQIINEPCFNVLRTQEQLGYIIFSGVCRTSGVQGLRVIVQSDKDPQHVEERVEAFLWKMGADLENLADEVFEKHVTSLAFKHLETRKKLTAQHAEYWGDMISQQYHFDHDNTEVRHLRTLTKNNICQFYKQLITENAPECRELTTYVTSYVGCEGAPTSSPSICTICREECTERDRNRTLSCEHCFHQNCITFWFKESKTCPNCRLSEPEPADLQELVTEETQPHEEDSPSRPASVFSHLAAESVTLPHANTEESPGTRSVLDLVGNEVATESITQPHASTSEVRSPGPASVNSASDNQQPRPLYEQFLLDWSDESDDEG